MYLVLTKSEMDRLLTSRGQWTHPAHRLKDQFDVLVTEIVDCCYFWANADDGVSTDDIRICSLKPFQPKPLYQHQSSPYNRLFCCENIGIDLTL